MTCHPLRLWQPTPSFFNLLFMAWTCWTHALHSWFTWLLFQEGENRDKFQPNFEAHQPPIPLSTLQGLGLFVTQTNQRLHTNFTLHQPNPTTKDSNTCTPSQTTSFIVQNPSQIHLSMQPLLRRPTDNVSSQDKSQRHIQAL